MSSLASVVVASFLLPSAIWALPPAPSCRQAPADIKAWLATPVTDFVDKDAVILQNGTVNCPVGKVGRAFEFTGPADVNALYSDPISIGTGEFTFEGWVFYDPILNPSTENRIVGDGDQLNLNYGDNFGLHLHYGAAFPNHSSVMLPHNQWVHFAVRYSAGLVEYFVDGIFKDSKSIAPGSYVPKFGTLGVQLGDQSAWWGGMLDEISIYSRALTDAEILDIYTADNVGKGAPQPVPTIQLIPAPIAGYISPSTSILADGVDSYFETSHSWILEDLTSNTTLVQTYSSCTTAGLFFLPSLTIGHHYRVSLGLFNELSSVAASTEFRVGFTFSLNPETPLADAQKGRSRGRIRP